MAGATCEGNSSPPPRRCAAQELARECRCQRAISRTPFVARGNGAAQLANSAAHRAIQGKAADDRLSLTDVARNAASAIKSFHAILPPHCWRKSRRMASGTQGIASEHSFLRISQAVPGPFKTAGRVTAPFCAGHLRNSQKICPASRLCDWRAPKFNAEGKFRTARPWC